MAPCVIVIIIVIVIVTIIVNFRTVLSAWSWLVSTPTTSGHTTIFDVECSKVLTNAVTTNIIANIIANIINNIINNIIKNTNTVMIIIIIIKN